MNIFLYDTKINQKAFEKILAQIETRITDLGLNGKIIRLGPAQSVAEIIDSEVRKGAKTIVAVGGNLLFNLALNALAKLQAMNLTDKKTPLAYIPVGEKNNFIAVRLGLVSHEDACDILSARRVEKFPLGRVNNQYFLTRIALDTKNTKLEIDENYTLEFLASGEVIVTNPLPDDLSEHLANQPTYRKGRLELRVDIKKTHKLMLLYQNNNRSSFFAFNRLKIYNDQETLLIDGCLAIRLPALVCLAEEKINLIVGKNRRF